MTKWRLPELLSSLSARVSSPKAGTGGDGEPADQEASRLAERPVDRSVLWLPGGWGEHHGSRPFPYELFVEQDVLREVEAHAHEEVPGSYGLLSGRLLTCRRTRIPFVHVEATHRSNALLPEGEDLNSFREFFWVIREKVGRRGRVVVGWYHTHALLGLQLSERDRQLHVAHFHDDWSCALVVVTRHGKAEGGFFQRDRGDILFRRSTRPFHEIVNQTVRPGGGPYVTAVSWENYWSHEPVLFARQPGDPATRGGQWYWRRRDSRSRPAGGILGLGRTALEGSDESRREPAAQPGEVEDRKPPEPRYEPAMGRPRQVDDAVAERDRPEHAGAPPADPWAQWKQGLEARRERAQERRKLETEQAEADADRRARARLAAQAAADAAARAAAEALGIESESDAVSAEAVSRAEQEAADLVSRRRRLPKTPAVSEPRTDGELQESARVKAGDEPSEPVERVEPDEAGAPAAEAPVAEEPVAEVEVPAGLEVTRAAEEVVEEPAPAAEAPVAEEPVDEVEVPGEVESAGEAEEPAGEAEVPTGPEVTREAEEVTEELVSAADLPPDEAASKQPDIEPARAQLELEAQPEPLEAALADAEVEAIPQQVAEPDMAEPEATEPEATEPEIAEPAPTEPSPLPARVVARSDIVQAAGDGSLVPPFVLANPPRLRLRRYALWVGLALPAAAVIAWLLFG